MSTVLEISLIVFMLSTSVIMLAVAAVIIKTLRDGV